MKMWNVVVSGKLGGVVGLATSWWSSNENLNRVQTSVQIELFVQFLDVPDDTLLGVPFEL